MPKIENVRLGKAVGYEPPAGCQFEVVDFVLGEFPKRPWIKGDWKDMDNDKKAIYHTYKFETDHPDAEDSVLEVVAKDRKEALLRIVKAFRLIDERENEILFYIKLLK